MQTLRCHESADCSLEGIRGRFLEEEIKAQEETGVPALPTGGTVCILALFKSGKISGVEYKESVKWDKFLFSVTLGGVCVKLHRDEEVV